MLGFPLGSTALLRALTVITQGALEGNSEAAFRTSLVRTTLKLDTKPTHESAMAFHKHLLEEEEAHGSWSDPEHASRQTPSNQGHAGCGYIHSGLRAGP